jgi:hypothetical protein
MTDGFVGFKRPEISFPARAQHGAKPSIAGVFATFWRVQPCQSLTAISTATHLSIARINLPARVAKRQRIATLLKDALA